MNKARLLKLADFLDTLPAKKFDLGRWVSQPKIEFSCGTAACACGWATQVPALRKAGLRLVPGNAFGGGVAAPAFRGLEGWAAVRKFFGVGAEVSRHLFEEFEYRGRCSTRPGTVAKRIRRLVETGVAK